MTLGPRKRVRNSTGRKLELDENWRQIWDLIAYDLAGANPDRSDDVDACVECIVGQCLVNLGITCEPSWVMSFFAHICPHILDPSPSAVVAFCMSGMFGEIVGRAASQRMRSILARHILHIVGEPPPLDADALLQDS